MHAHGVVSDLIAAVIKEVQLPLEVNKLEGDAIFLVARKQDEGWADLGISIGQRLAAEEPRPQHTLPGERGSEFLKKRFTQVIENSHRLLIIPPPRQATGSVAQD